MKTRIIPLGLIVAAIWLGAGCARPDWIQDTLVTVNVTGVWVATAQAAGAATIRLELEQQGSKVKGHGAQARRGNRRALGTGATTGPIDGTVAGDVFSFRQTNGVLTGEVTVAGDEMTGRVTGSGTSRISFQRIGSSPRPSSQP